MEPDGRACRYWRGGNARCAGGGRSGGPADQRRPVHAGHVQGIDHDQPPTEVEPDTFSNGSTIVAAFQVGRIFDGGACAIGFATSTNNGATWTSGLLPGITKCSGSGPNDRATDASVAYDARHNVWLISSLTLLEAGGVHGNAVVTSRSTDGGLTWSSPVTTATGGDLDKNWIVCDNTATSPFYGHCYTQWDDHGAATCCR